MKFDSGFSKTEKTGYLLPSVTLVLAIGVWLIGKKHHLAQKLGVAPLSNTGSTEKIKSTIELLNSVFLGNSAVTIVLILLTIAALVFILAHVIDTLSEYVFERLFANKLQGYPHERLVPYAYTTSRYKKFRASLKTQTRANRFLYEGLKSLLFILITFPLIWMIHRHLSTDKDGWQFLPTTVLLITFWVCLSLVWSFVLLLIFSYQRFASTSKVPLETRETDTFNMLMASSSNAIFDFFLKYLWLAFVGVWAYGFDFLEKTIRSLFQLNSEIEGDVYTKAKDILFKKTGIDIGTLNNNDRIWIPYYFLITENKSSIKNIQEFESKAMFYRNQALALFLCCALLAGSFDSNHSTLETFLSPKDLMNLSFASYFMAVFFVGRFFQHYYSASKCVFRACAVLSDSASNKTRNAKQN